MNRTKPNQTKPNKSNRVAVIVDVVAVVLLVAAIGGGSAFCIVARGSCH